VLHFWSQYMSLSAEGLGKRRTLGVTRIGFSSGAHQHAALEDILEDSPPYFLITYMSHSGSRFITERMAMKSEDDLAYHGPLNPDSGWKKCTYTMRQVTAATRAVSNTNFTLRV
jgi:hypothetical protein